MLDLTSTINNLKLGTTYKQLASDAGQCAGWCPLETVVQEGKACANPKVSAAADARTEAGAADVRRAGKQRDGASQRRGSRNVDRGP